jgi:hypothetical protein
VPWTKVASGIVFTLHLEGTATTHELLTPSGSVSHLTDGRSFDVSMRFKNTDASSLPSAWYCAEFRSLQKNALYVSLVLRGDHFNQVIESYFNHTVAAADKRKGQFWRDEQETRALLIRI